MEHIANAVDPFVFRLSIFVLAVFVGYYVVWSVTPALHTPLMSVTNAISSVIVVGALLAVGVALIADDNGTILARALGFVALVFASVNIFGGFLVTQRMLAMYQKKEVTTMGERETEHVSRAQRSASSWCAAEPGPFQTSRLRRSRICGAPFHAAPRPGHGVSQ